MKILHSLSLSAFAAAISVSMPFVGTAQNAPAAAPKFLFDSNEKLSAGRITDAHETVKTTPSGGGIEVEIAGSEAGYPGFSIVPSSGKTWDLSPWGHVAAKVTNTGDKPISVNLRVDDDGDWRESPWNAESTYLKGGETKVITVIFGYQYGHKPGYKLKSDRVTKLLFFGSKSNDKRTFRLEEILAGGPAGEKPPVPPDQVQESPRVKGIMMGGAVAHPFEHEPIAEGKNGTIVTRGKKGEARLTAEAGKAAEFVLRPRIGSWNLNTYHEVMVEVRNQGKVAVTPTLRVGSRSGATDLSTAPEPILPGKTKRIRVSFAPAKSWVGTFHSQTSKGGTEVGTGTSFDSCRVNSVTVKVAETAEPTDVVITAIVAGATPAVCPAWLGKRPPVEGAWKKTLSEEFNGKDVNLHLWNLYTPNFWDNRTHFTRENAILRDGKLILRYEKKRGFHNDDPNDKSSVAKTDYACGFVDSYGKWTQRYGYFEARMKLPRCPGLWPAFWTMPDRGGDPDPAINPQWKRASTSDGGMEFDIMEHLTAWGPYRFNFAFHWDGYGKEHKSIGSSNAYVPTDAEGFFTIGMLWLPGEIVYYGNGIEIARWKSERVCSVQSYPIFYMVSGGWANTPLDPEQLPDEFVIDYFRAWQRADLASPEDGPKPNAGAPRSQF